MPMTPEEITPYRLGKVHGAGVASAVHRKANIRASFLDAGRS
jgi:hypothetical protein